jgi:hypothetical protein
VAEGVIELHLGLTKQRYYELLAESKFHVNTALQDWVSYTMLEASALEVITIAPSFRGFPDCIASPDQLYIPFHVSSMEERIHHWMKRGWEPALSRPAADNSLAMTRIIDNMVLG